MQKTEDQKDPTKFLSYGFKLLFEVLVPVAFGILFVTFAYHFQNADCPNLLKHSKIVGVSAMIIAFISLLSISMMIYSLQTNNDMLKNIMSTILILLPIVTYIYHFVMAIIIDVKYQEDKHSNCKQLKVIAIVYFMTLIGSAILFVALILLGIISWFCCRD